MRDDVGHLGGEVTGVHDYDLAQRAQRGMVVVIYVLVGRYVRVSIARNAVDIESSRGRTLFCGADDDDILTMLDGESPKRVLSQVINNQTT